MSSRPNLSRSSRSHRRARRLAPLQSQLIMATSDRAARSSFFRRGSDRRLAMMEYLAQGSRRLVWTTQWEAPCAEPSPESDRPALSNPQALARRRRRGGPRLGHIGWRCARPNSPLDDAPLLQSGGAISISLGKSCDSDGTRSPAAAIPRLRRARGRSKEA